MASKSKPTMIQKSMYPKDLVYPPNGGELQFEMIRAQWSMYNTSIEENEICDMDITEAFTANITLNIPVKSSIKQGKIVNVLSENRQQQRINTTKVPSNEILNEELMKLCQDNAENMPAQKFFNKKNLASSDKGLVDVELQLQQLELEHELESRISQENLVNKENIISKKTKSKNRLELRHESESLVLSKDSVANKENEVSKKNKPGVFHFTPSINDDSSLASWHGSSLMGTHLSFSVAESYYEEPSASSFMGHDNKSRTKMSSSQRVGDPLTIFENQSEENRHRMEPSKIESKESFSVFEEPSFTNSYNQPQSNRMQPLSVLQQNTSKSRPNVNVTSERTDFSVFKEPSISDSYNQPQSNRMQPLSVLQQNTSKSRPNVNVTSERTDFSVFKEPSISDSYNQPQSNRMQPLSVLQQNTSKSRPNVNVTSERTDFSVFEEPSISDSYNQPQSNRMQPLSVLQQNTSKSRPNVNVTSERTDFSVFEEPSISDSYNQPQSNRMQPLSVLQQNTSKSRPNVNVTSERTDFSVFEEPSISDSYNQPQSNRMQPLSVLQQNTSKSRPNVNVTSERTDFSVFEEPSISDSYNQPQSNRMQPFSVLQQNTSKSRPNVNVTSERTDFSVFEEPSISDSYNQPQSNRMQPLSVLQQNTSKSRPNVNVTSERTDFSVFEEPSISDSYNQPQSNRMQPPSVLQQNTSKSRPNVNVTSERTDFSVFEEPSISDSYNQPQSNRMQPFSVLQQNTSKSRPNVNVTSERTDFSVFEEPSISDSYNQPQSNRMQPLSVLQQNTSKSRPNVNVTSERTDFSVFEEPSISDSYNQPQSNRMQPFSVLQQNTSKSRPNVNVTSERTDFRVFEEPSISDSYNQPQSNRMQPLSVLQQNTSKSRSNVNVTSERTDFSVFEEPSISDSYNQPQSNRMQPLSVLQQNTSKSRSNVNVTSERTDFSVFEEPSISDSYNQPQSNRMQPLSVLQQNTSKSRPNVNVTSERTDFSVFEEPSFTNSYNQPQSNRMQPPSVLQQNTSKSRPNVNDFENFDVFEQPSINTEPEKLRKPLGLLKQNLCPANEAKGQAFSVFQDPSLCKSAHKMEDNVNKQIQDGGNNNNQHASCFTDQTRKKLVPSSLAPFQEIPGGFTEFEIPSYDKYEPTSTPTGKRMGFNMSVDLTMIHPNDTIVTKDLNYGILTKNPPNDKPANPLNIVAPMCSLPPGNPVGSLSVIGASHSLETIQEESRSNYTSSTSGSTNTNSSRYSINSVFSYNNENELMQDLMKGGIVNGNGLVNVFTSEAINFMCQSIPITNTPVIEVSAPLPRIISGNNISIGESKFTIIKKLATGGFATIYEVVNSQRPMELKKVLKVQKPSFVWEVAILEELHKRLQANDLVHMAACFMKVDRICIYNDASITVYNYYKHGSLLDLVNKSKGCMGESLLLYYTIELLDIVETLHSCGIIHADIKPDNIMLRDTRSFNHISQARGQGMCLIDFGRAIDMQPFPKGSKFIGSNGTDRFQCIQMIENTPWTYQTDLYSIAGTVHVMMFKKYMETKKDSSGEYRIITRMSRGHDNLLWTWFYSMLLNWKPNEVSQRLDLSTISRSLLDKLQSVYNVYDSIWSFLDKMK